MPSDPGLASTRQVSRNQNINLRRYKMKLTILTRDDMNNIMDTLNDQDRSMSVEQDVDGSVVLDMGNFLTAYANATVSYVAKRKEFRAILEEAQ
jgi:hypothetical protein